MTTINVSDGQKIPAAIIYDTANSIQGVDSNTSNISNAPSVIQLDTIGATTTVKIQSRIHSTASWKDEGSFTSADGVVVFTFAVKRNYVRLLRSSGSGAVKGYAQS
jgi:hypothetical protein